MCQATVFPVQDGQEKEMIRDVISLEAVEKSVQLRAVLEKPVLGARFVDLVLLTTLEQRSAE